MDERNLKEAAFEVKKKKAEMEADILGIVNEFEKQTGFEVTDITAVKMDSIRTGFYEPGEKRTFAIRTEVAL